MSVHRVYHEKFIRRRIEGCVYVDVWKEEEGHGTYLGVPYPWRPDAREGHSALQRRLGVQGKGRGGGVVGRHSSQATAAVTTIPAIAIAVAIVGLVFVVFED